MSAVGIRCSGLEAELAVTDSRVLWAVGEMEDGPFARVLCPKEGGGWNYGEDFADTPTIAFRNALAKARGEA